MNPFANITSTQPNTEQLLKTQKKSKVNKQKKKNHNVVHYLLTIYLWVHL